MKATFSEEIHISSSGVQKNNLGSRIYSLDQQKITDLNNNIRDGILTLKNNYDKLQQVSSPLVENEYLGGLIRTTNIEKSLQGVLSVIQGVAQCTLGAFTANGKNLEAILELLRISVSIENDLYRQLEECDYSKENIASLLGDFCAQYDIDSEAIIGLFEQSFNRTLTLRTKIKSLREEILERISKFENELGRFEETLREKEKLFVHGLERQTEECKRQLESEHTEFQKRIEILSENIAKLQKRSMWSVAISVVSFIIAIISIML